VDPLVAEVLGDRLPGDLADRVDLRELVLGEVEAAEVRRELDDAAG
jgi:hypothetical protein